MQQQQTQQQLQEYTEVSFTQPDYTTDDNPRQNHESYKHVVVSLSHPRGVEIFCFLKNSCVIKLND